MLSNIQELVVFFKSTLILVYMHQASGHSILLFEKHYRTLDTVTNATKNENYPFGYQISLYINIDMLSQNATGHITTSKMTAIYSIHFSL